MDKGDKDNKEISKMESKDSILTMNYLNSEKMKKFYKGCIKNSDLSRSSITEQEEFMKDEKIADHFIP